MNFDLDQLRAFDAVMRLNNFRAAADALGTPQSSLSQQIGRLEAQLGRRLFERTTRRVAPTPEARAFRSYVRSILSIAEETRRHFERPPLDGVLRLGIVEDFALGELHFVLGVFRRQFPRFGLSLKTGLSTRLFRGLDDGTLDVVLAKRLPGRSQGTLLFSRPLVWCGDGALVADGAVPVVTYVEPSSMRALIVAALKAAGRPFAIVAESEGLSGIQAAVAAGFGITAFAEGFVPHGVGPLPDACGLPPAGRVEYVIDQRAAPHTEAIDAFVALLASTSLAAAGDEGAGRAGDHAAG